jgi:hypothetical protein
MSMIEYLEKMWVLAANGYGQGVFFWSALYALLMLLYSFMFQIRVTSWPSTEGELINEGIKEFGYAYAKSDKRYIASVYYKYVVQGNEYVGKRLSPWFFITNNNASFFLKNQLNSILRHSSGLVTVYYNPNKPSKSFLIKPGLIGKCVTVALAVIPFLMYWQKYYG